MKLVSIGPHPWEKRKSESPQAYAAFNAFLDLGTERTVVDAYRRHTRKPQVRQASGRWNKWSRDFEWETRASAYDAHLKQVEMRALEQARIKRALELERRRIQAEDMMWEKFQALSAKVDQMLKIPILETTIEGGKTIIKPARWTFSTLANLIAVMCKLGQLAMEAADSAAAEAMINIDWESLSDEQLDRIARGESPLRVLNSPHQPARSRAMR